MIDDIFCTFMQWIKVVRCFTLSFTFSVFQDRTFAKLPDKNLDYLVAERIDKNINYRYIEICVSNPFFFPCTCCYKGNTNKKKKLNCTTFPCLSLHCHHLNEGAVIRGTSKGRRPNEHSGKRLWKRKCQDNVSTEKKWQENWYVFLNYLQV